MPGESQDDLVREQKRPDLPRLGQPIIECRFPSNGVTIVDHIFPRDFDHLNVAVTVEEQVSVTSCAKDEQAFIEEPPNFESIVTPSLEAR